MYTAQLPAFKATLIIKIMKLNMIQYQLYPSLNKMRIQIQIILNPETSNYTPSCSPGPMAGGPTPKLNNLGP